MDLSFAIIATYFRDQYLERLVSHQLESYNQFIEQQIHKTIAHFNPLHITPPLHFQQYNYHNGHHNKSTHHHHQHQLQQQNQQSEQQRQNIVTIEIEFANLAFYRPQIHENNGATKLMFPHEARLRNFTYAAVMTVDIHVRTIVKAPITLDIIGNYVKIFHNINIGKMPVMLKSNICILNQYPYIPAEITSECKYDPGGYFIINGSEKTVLGQERSCENKIFCYDVAKTSNKYLWQAEIRCVPTDKCLSSKQVLMMISCKNNGFGFPIVVQIPRLRMPIPLFILFRAFGVLSDRAICDMILQMMKPNTRVKALILEKLKASIFQAGACMTTQDALMYISSITVSSSSSSAAAVASAAAAAASNIASAASVQKKIDYARHVLQTDIFTHCGNDAERLYFLGYMAKRILLCYLKILPPDDRDSYLNKRVDLTGPLLNGIFRSHFHKMVKEMEKHIMREILYGSWRSTDDYQNIIHQNNIYKMVKSVTVENGIKRCLSTGDFGLKQHNTSRVGVAQVLNRLTYISSISHSRRIATPTDKSGKLIPPRKLHGTSWGFVCPVETPEGQSVGIVKNLSYMTHVTCASSTRMIYDLLQPFLQTLDVCCGVDVSEDANMTKVFVNGTWIGIVVNTTSLELYYFLKRSKWSGVLNLYTSIVFDYQNNEIRICNDCGRLTRPVLRVCHEQHVLVIDSFPGVLDTNHELVWEDLISTSRFGEAIIEYIDADEQAAALIAMHPSDITDNGGKLYTHCEIHPSTIFGILASCIPFPEHNQSPRNTYQCAQAKQAIGMYVTNFDKRMDKTVYVLSTPARPLVDTRIMDFVEMNRIPSGFNAIVAIMSHTGYNQEDSLLFNQGSIDRGIFQATIFHTEKDEEKQRMNGEEEIRCRPDPLKTKGMKFGNYGKLSPNGTVPENSFIENRDVILSKVIPIKENKMDPSKLIKYEDQSRLFRTEEDSYVDKNLCDRNGDGYKFAKVRIRQIRKPVIGDKFSSRSGQKGTIGNILPEKDMPFTRNGLRPDLILNPHAIPSRMTIAQLKETLMGKILLELGMYGDGTSFGNLDIMEISTVLQKWGYESYGNELMYDPLSGKQLACSIFIGPVYYQRLKHMVVDKQHSRSIGPMVNLTRQPAEGRSRDGGLRFGEMERDCMMSHGASRFTRERLFDVSDQYRIYICNKCGLTASFNDDLHIHICRTCENRTSFSLVEIPYACKLLFQELTTMNVVPRLLTED